MCFVVNDYNFTQKREENMVRIQNVKILFQPKKSNNFINSTEPEIFSN